MKAKEEGRLVTQALETLASAIEKGESERLTAYLATLGRFHQYSLSNVFLIAAQRPDATRVAGFRTWQRLGRHVRRGEKGIRILAPIVWRRKCEQPGDEAEEVLRFRSVCVFDVAQTDGRPLPEFAQATGDPGEYTSRLIQFAGERGIKVEFSDVLRSADGLSAGGTILVRKGLPPAEEFSVLTHELAHELLHQVDQGRPSSRTARETEAEAVAFVVCQAIGLDAADAAADYIHLYRGSKDTLLESLQRIRRAAAEIIGAIVGNGDGQCEAVETGCQEADGDRNGFMHAARTRGGEKDERC